MKSICGFGAEPSSALVLFTANMMMNQVGQPSSLTYACPTSIRRPVDRFTRYQIGSEWRLVEEK